MILVVAVWFYWDTLYSKQEVKLIWQKAPHGGPIPRLGSPQGVESCTIEFLGYGFLLVFHSNYRPRMHRLATVHARDNQRPTTNQPKTNQPTNDQRRHDTAYLNKRLFY